MTDDMQEKVNTRIPERGPEIVMGLEEIAEIEREKTQWENTREKIKDEIRRAVTDRSVKLMNLNLAGGRDVAAIYGRYKKDTCIHCVHDIYDEYAKITRKESKLPAYARKLISAYITQISTDMKMYRKLLEIAEEEEAQSHNTEKDIV